MAKRREGISQYCGLALILKMGIHVSVKSSFKNCKLLNAVKPVSLSQCCEVPWAYCCDVIEILYYFDIIIIII